MCKILCVTNRKLCGENFLARVEQIAKERPQAIILREKDLPDTEYMTLAKSVMEICNRYSVNCILHSHISAALQLKAPAIHLPLGELNSLTEEQKKAFTLLGASCHSVGEAVEAERKGCNYIMAGHIYNTDCKHGVPGRGLDFLREVVNSVSIPVYAIGGINFDNIKAVIKSGAKGACVMSGAMTCKDVKKYFYELKNQFADCEDK